MALIVLRPSTRGIEYAERFIAELAKAVTKEMQKSGLLQA
jgi:hypothetical protein